VGARASVEALDLGWAGLRERANREVRGPVRKEKLFLYIFQ
jgi:hypothetical protein